MSAEEVEVLPCGISRYPCAGCFAFGEGDLPDLDRLCILDEFLEGEVLVATCSVLSSTAVAMVARVSVLGWCRLGGVEADISIMIKDSR